MSAAHAPVDQEEVSGIVAGDVTGEDSVDLAAYAIIRDNFRLNVSSRMLGDLSGDGTVDFVDFLEWRNNSSFGKLSFAELNALTHAAPEPSAGLLALAGWAAASIRRRRG